MGNLFPHIFHAWSEIQGLRENWTSDEEFGKAVRELLEDIASGKRYQYSSVELDSPPINNTENEKE
jgi:hypothetical protein